MPRILFVDFLDVGVADGKVLSFFLYVNPSQIAIVSEDGSRLPMVSQSRSFFTWVNMLTMRFHLISIAVSSTVLINISSGFTCNPEFPLSLCCRGASVTLFLFEGDNYTFCVKCTFSFQNQPRTILDLKSWTPRSDAAEVVGCMQI